MHRFLSIVWWLSVCSVCSVGTLRSQPANVQADPTTGVLFRPSAATFISGNNLATATGGIVLGANGGTGVANTGKTITLGGNLTTSGAFGLTLTLSGTTNVTLPTSGQLATLSGGEILTNKTLTSPTLTTPILGAATATSLTLSGNISSAAWTTSGVRLKGVAATFTDTTSTGTVAAAYTDVLGGNTIAASNATTFTDYITAYFREPTAGSLVTMTNKWALGSESLRVGTSTPMTVSTAGAITANSLTGQTTTALTLTGGSTGASLVLGQGATGAGSLSRRLAVTAVDASPPSSGTTVVGGMRLVSANNVALDLGINGSSSPFPGWIQVSDATNQATHYPLVLQGTGSNVLIGGTTDITGSGGLKVFGTTAASSTASGALQVAGGVGVAGAGFFGGTANAARFTVGGGTGSADRMIEATGTHSGTASSLFGVVVNPTVPATTTTAAYGAFIAPETASGSFTLANAYGLYVQPFTPNGSATITNNYAIYATGRVNVAATTSASSSTVGALTIGNGTAATNVAIGGGNVNAGGTLTSGYHSATPPASLGTYNAGIPTSLLKDILVAGDASRRVAIAAYQDSSPYAQWSFTSQGTEFVRMSTNPSSVVASGVLSVLGTSASTGVGTGALQVAGGIYAGAASVFGSPISVINGSTSADLILSRPTTSLGSTVQYKTGATINWYHGTRGLANNNWYLFNNNLSTNTLILDYATDAATFAGAVTAGGNVAMPSGSTLSFGAGVSPGNSYTLYGTGALTYLNVPSGGTIRMSDNNSTALLSMSLAGGASFYGAGTFGGLISSTQAGSAAAAVEAARLTNTTTTGSVYLNFNETNSAATPAYLIRYGSTHASSANILELAATGTGAKFRVLPAMSISNTTAGSAGAGALVVSGGLATGAASYLGGDVTMAGAAITSSATLSGAGAIPITTSLVKFTSTGAANALTLANGVDGQRLTIVHDVKGTLGTGVLTPTTKTGFSTVTFNNAGDTVSLVYVTTRGWMVTGSYLATIAP